MPVRAIVAPSRTNTQPEFTVARLEMTEHRVQHLMAAIAAETNALVPFASRLLNLNHYSVLLYHGRHDQCDQS